MYMLRGIMDCHRRLMMATEALLTEMDVGEVTPKFLHVRFQMAVPARDNLVTTQRLWNRIEAEIPDIRTHLLIYDRIKDADREIHTRYSDHIAAWPVSAISADFSGFAQAKRRFINDMCHHNRRLEKDLLEPAFRILNGKDNPNVRAA